MKRNERRKKNEKEKWERKDSSYETEKEEERNELPIFTGKCKFADNETVGWVLLAFAVVVVAS